MALKLDTIYRKVLAGERISKSEGLYLFKNAELLSLGELANEIRFRKNPNPWVTYVSDANPNYSNICEVACDFCAFHRKKNEDGAYLLSVDELIEKFKKYVLQGVTSVLLQGGINSDIPFDYYLELVERTVKEVPQIHPHFFSPPEVIAMSKSSGLSVEDVLSRLWEKGLRSIPGGGAEILSDRVKKKISCRKGDSSDWLNVMRIAHGIGYKTTATMMFGHVEDNEDIIIHLDAIRSLQDETGGFTAFVPWSFKPKNTRLGKINSNLENSTKYLQIIALARIYLDNFQHIQASWFSEGKKLGQIALHFGADDFGGTLIEENVHAAANFINRTNIDECRRLIKESGFIPMQRTTLYEIIESKEKVKA